MKSKKILIPRILLLLFLLVFFTGCARSFSPPPDQVSIDGIFPDSGFLGAMVTIDGRNFDPAVSNNLVFFGNSSATVVDASTNQLRVEVPVLAVDDTVSVTISAPRGQGTSPVSFHYLGPGHPLEEKIDHVLKLESGPSSVSMFLPTNKTLSMIPALVTNSASNSISFMDLNSGFQMSFGVHGQPSSGIILPLEGFSDPQDITRWPPECWKYVNRYLIFLTTIEETQDKTLKPALAEFSLVAAIKDHADFMTCKQTWLEHGADSADFAVALEPIPVSLQIDPQIAQPDDPPFMPGQVRSVCLDMQNDASEDQDDWRCNDILLVLTDLYRPVMTMFLYSNQSGQYTLTPMGSSIFGNKGSYCTENQQDGDRLGKILDLAQVPGSLDFDLIVENRPEIWQVSLRKENDKYLLSDPELIWPRADSVNNWDSSEFSLDDICRQTLSAITTSTDPDKALKSLYLSSSYLNRIFELRRISLPVQGVTVIPSRTITTDSPVFSLNTAMTKDPDGLTEEILYAASESGLLLIGLGTAPTACTNDDDCPQGLKCILSRCQAGPLRTVDFLSLPGSVGNSSALARYGVSLDDATDIIALADTARNQVISLTADSSLSGAKPFMVGNTMPQIAVSQFGDYLYLSNPLDNSIQVINMNTGVQKSKFSIHDGNTFGATGMMCIHDSGEDLLIIPLADQYMRPEKERKTFNDLVLRKSNSLGQLTSLGVLDNPGEVDASAILDIQAHEFNEILIGQMKKAFFFVQYSPDNYTSGLLWPALASASLDDGSFLVDGNEMRTIDSQIDPEARPMDPMVKIARLDPDVQILAFWEPVVDGVAEDTGKISIYPLDDHNAPAILELLIPPPVSRLVSDIAVIYRRNFIRMFFALPDAGKILVARSSLDGSQQDQKYIQTSGAPFRMVFSPDGKRLFVTHRSEAKISVIDADCLPEPQCEDDSECEPGRVCSLGFCVPDSPCEIGELCSEDDDCPGQEEQCARGVCTSDEGKSNLCPEGTRCETFSTNCIPEFCEEAESTLNLESTARDVVFSPSGDKAFITHHNSNRITVVQ